METGRFSEQLRSVLKAVYVNIDRAWLMEHTKALTEIEHKQTYSAYHKSAEYVKNLLLAEGFEPEVLTFPADGKTVYQDKGMPLAWEASVGRLTVKKTPISFSDPVIADYAKMPFSFVKHSVSTPEGGIYTRLVTLEQVYAGEDCTGGMVLLGEDIRPQGTVIKTILDMGALGFVSEYVKGSLEAPEDVQWVNAGTEGVHWHVQADDREFIAFSISHKTARDLRKAANAGDVEVLVESDGIRYEGTFHAVTALIPGRSKRELWVLAHLYEPLLTDNSLGVIGAIEMMKQIREMTKSGILPPLEFSIRLVFTMELYGYAAVAEHFGGYLGDKTIGAVIMDAFAASKYDNIWTSIDYAPATVPFYGNYIMEMAKQVYNDTFDGPLIVDGGKSYGDDAFLSDSTTGLPTIFPREEGMPFWHNSVMCKDFVDEENFVRGVSFFTAWTAGVSALCASHLEDALREAVQLAKAHIEYESRLEHTLGNQDDRMAFLCKLERNALLDFRKLADTSAIYAAADEIKVPQTEGRFVPQKWLTYAGNIVPCRTHVGLPHDLKKLPLSERKRLPGSIIYDTLAFILSAIDGKKTLAQAICEAAWETHRTLSEKDVKGYVNAVLYLAEAGYLSVQNNKEITREMIENALQELGIEKGDLLLVHSGLSHLGHIENGPEDVIEALMNVVGEEGTVLMPSFTRPYISFEGTINKRSDFRPFDLNDKENVSTGIIVKTFLNRSGVIRSKHATHSWCGIGAKAKACLSRHTLLDAPASTESPLAIALQNNGKVLFFGCDINCNTFIHFIEDQCNSDFLENAVVKVCDESGRLHTEVIKKHLPGHRDFYASPAEKCKFYQRALKRGLNIKRVTLGLGCLSLIDLRELYKIGMKLFKEDPYVTLCDDVNCMFCRQYRK